MKQYFRPIKSAILPCNTGRRAAPRKPIVRSPDATAVFFPIPSIDIAYKVGKKIEIKNPSNVMEITAMMPVVVIIMRSKTIAVIRQNTSVTAGRIFF